MKQFNATETLSKIKEDRKQRRRKIYKQSVIDKYRAEVIALKKEGASLGDIEFFLREKKIKVVRSTIKRYLDKYNG